MKVVSIKQDAGQNPPVAYRVRQIPLRRWGVLRRRSRALVTELINEQARIGDPRQSSAQTHLEEFTRATGQQGRDRVRIQGARKVGQIAGKTDERRAEVDLLERQIVALQQEPVVGPHGETLTVAQAAAKEQTLVDIVEEASRAGSHQHDRVSERARRRARRSAWIDFPVFCLLLGSVFNVDWAALFALDTASLGGTLPSLAVTLGLAAVGTYYLALVLSQLSTALKVYKNDKGHLELPQGQGRRRGLLYLGLLASVVLGAGAVMSYRIVHDAEAAQMSGPAAWMLGLFLGLVVMSLNVVIITTHYCDGSPLTDQIDHLHEQLAVVRKVQQRLRLRIAEIEPAIEKLIRRGERLSAGIEAKAIEPMVAAEQIILVARSYHLGCGWQAVDQASDSAERKADLLDSVTKGLRAPWVSPGSAQAGSSSTSPVSPSGHGDNGSKPDEPEPGS